MVTDATLFTAITETSIARLVEAFYARVRRDPVLGPVFDAAITEAAWPAHLERMNAFWSSLMLTTGRYKGDPLAVHQRVGGMAPELFGRWLDLFESTAATLFVPGLAEQFVIKARRVAESLRVALFWKPGVAWPDDLRHRPPLAASAG